MQLCYRTQEDAPPPFARGALQKIRAKITLERGHRGRCQLQMGLDIGGKTTPENFALTKLRGKLKNLQPIEENRRAIDP